MEGKQFSSSRGVVIYVRDVLERYQPDALRYFISAAGPENQDSNFTWAEFVRRTNDELVAGWGNLVNRTANMIAKSFGEIPPAGDLTEADQALLDAVEAAFGAVGELIERHRQKAALAEAMRTVAEVNKYVSDSAPWALKGDDERDRLAHDPARRRAGRRRLQPAPRAVPAAQRQRRGPGAGRGRRRGAHARDPRGRGPRRRSRLPDPHRRVLRLPGLAAADPSCPARPSRSRCRCSPSSTRPWSRRSWRGCARRSRHDAPPAVGRCAPALGRGAARQGPGVRSGRHPGDARREPPPRRLRAEGARRPGPGRRRRRCAVPALRASRRHRAAAVPARRWVRASATWTPTTRRRAAREPHAAGPSWPSTTGGRPSTRSPRRPTTSTSALRWLVRQCGGAGSRR